MIAGTETCTSCGEALRAELPGLGGVCPRCLVRSAQTPTGIETPNCQTTWAEVFPQLEIESVLRDDPEAPIYLARVVDEESAERAVLQVVCGQTLTLAGGPGALQARAQRLAGTDLDGLAEVLDLGDLADAFFLVTSAPDWPTVPESVAGQPEDEVATLLALVAEETEAIVQGGRAAKVALRFDPETCFVDAERGEVVLTPLLLTSGAGSSAEEPTGPIELQAGTRLGSFELVEAVGEGGFGQVWRARQEQPVTREVAIKVLKEGLHSQRARARFQAEQQALARLDHPHVARFLEGGTTRDGRPYFAMEWIEGTSLVRHCETHKVPLTERLRLFRDLAEAVQFAHQKGILHRDLKPSNVMVTAAHGNAEHPVVKVIDFGIARALEDPLTDGTLLTRADEVVGTPASMSPEQATGAGGSELDARTDVYGLGVLLYELLCGRLPFDPKLPPDELRRQIREVDPSRPSSRLEESDRKRRVRGDLDWITMRCLEKDSERRYRSVSALLRDLERHANDEPVEAGPPELSYRVGKFVRRNKVGVAATATVALALMATTAISWKSASRARNAEATTDRSLQELQVAYGDLDSARSRSRELLVHTLLEKGTKQFNEGDVTGLITLQEAVTAAEGDDALQDKALELWTLARTWLPGSVEAVIDLPYAVAVSPDAQWAAWCGQEGVQFLDVDEGLVTSIETDPRLTEVKFDERGNELDRLGLVFDQTSQRLALLNPENGVAQVWALPSGQPVSSLLEHPKTGRAPELHMLSGWEKIAFDPQGHHLATVSANGSACVWNLKSGQLATPPLELSGRTQYHSVRFSPGGGTLAVANGPVLEFLDLTTDPSASSQLTAPGSIHRVRFVGKSRILTQHYQHALLWDLVTGACVAEYTAPWSRGFHMLEDVAVSPEGDLLGLGSLRGELVVLESATLQVAKQPLPHPGGGVRSVAFSSEGSLVASGGRDGDMRYWSVNSKTLLGVWPQLGTIDQVASGSRGSNLIMTKSRSRAAPRTRSRAILRRFPREQWTVVGQTPEGSSLVDVSDDGKRLLSLSEDRLQLSVTSRTGSSISRGPELASDCRGITEAEFGLDGSTILFSASYAGNLHAHRRWNIRTGSYEEFSLDRSYGGNWVLRDLPTNPPLTAIRYGAWYIELVDAVTARTAEQIGLPSSATGFAVAARQGWYAIADSTGRIGRYSLQTHKGISPEIQHANPVTSVACLGDNQWLVTCERNPDDGVETVSAWFIEDVGPFERLKLPIPHTGGALFPVDQRSFLYQHGTELRRIDLPEVTIRPEQVEAATMAALGVRKDEHGELRLLTSAEFHAARAAVE